MWTADGWNLIFRSLYQPNPGIYGVRADGSGQPQRLLDLSAEEFPSSVSPDGKRLALWGGHAGGAIRMTPVESGRHNLSLGKAELFLTTPIDPAVNPRSAPAFSPDGRWLAYCSNESAQLEVYVVPFPGPSGKWRISTAGGKFPLRSRAHELFFLDLYSNQIMVTSYKEIRDSFIAATDGKRFAVVLYADGTAEQKPVTNITLLLNFFDELQRRAPTESK